MRRVEARFCEKEIDAIFRGLDQSHLPGVAIGIAIGGIPVYRKGFGLANMELPVALTPCMRMRIYSITKHFTCLAYLLFCEEGKAGIDDPIEKYLPDLHPVAHRVTMRQLMSNTSGLRDACGIRWFFSGYDITVPASELLDMYREMRDVNFDPGEAWCYNNGGFHILSAVIEKLADRSLEEVFRRRIFDPVGMDDSLLRRIDSDFVANSAAMHMIAPSGGYEKRYMSGELVGEGGIVSTIDDMLRWLKHIRQPVVGTPATWALMTASNKLHDGGDTGYGLGLVRCPYRGIDTISHSGGGLGNNSQLIRVPEADLDVIAISNRHDVYAPELVGQVLDSCLGLKPDSRRAQAACISGLFRSPTTARVMQLYAKEDVQMIFVDGGECPAVLSEENVLRMKPWCLSTSALRWSGDPARPESIRYESGGRSDELFPIAMIQTPGVESIVGEYLAETIGIGLTIVGRGRTGSVTTAGRFGSRTFQLDGIAGGVWKLSAKDATGAGGILAPDASRGGVSVATWGMRQVPFRSLS